MRWHEEQPRKTWASFVVTATIASQLGEGSELQASLPTSAFSPPNWASSVSVTVHHSPAASGCPLHSL